MCHVWWELHNPGPTEGLEGHVGARETEEIEKNLVKIHLKGCFGVKSGILGMSLLFPALSWKVLPEGSKLPHNQEQWEVGKPRCCPFWGVLKSPAYMALFKKRSAALGNCGWQEHVWM